MTLRRLTALRPRPRISAAYAQDVVFVSDAARATADVATPPGAPTGVTATAGNASATVSWTAPTNNGGAPIGSYIVTSSGGHVATALASARSITVSGLSNGVSYTFTVQATNSAGTGPASNPSNAVTPRLPAVELSAPSVVVSNEVSVNSWDLSWTSVAGAVSYEVYASAVDAAPGAPLFSWSRLATLTTNKLRVAPAGGFKGYYYRVRAIASDGTPSPWSNVVGAVSLIGIWAPTGLRRTSTSLTWDDTNDPRVTHFEIWRQDSAETWIKVGDRFYPALPDPGPRPNPGAQYPYPIWLPHVVPQRLVPPRALSGRTYHWLVRWYFTVMASARPYITDTKALADYGAYLSFQGNFINQTGVMYESTSNAQAADLHVDVVTDFSQASYFHYAESSQGVYGARAVLNTHSTDIHQWSDTKPLHYSAFAHEVEGHAVWGFADMYWARNGVPQSAVDTYQGIMKGDRPYHEQPAPDEVWWAKKWLRGELPPFPTGNVGDGLLDASLYGYYDLARYMWEKFPHPKTSVTTHSGASYEPGARYAVRAIGRDGRTGLAAFT